MIENIKKDLDTLADYRARLDALNLQKQDAINAVLTPEIRAELEAIEAEFSDKSEGARLNIEELEAQIKHYVIEHGASVKGEFLHAVYSKPRVSWDTKILDGMIALIPQIAEAKKFGSPSVSIRTK